jgi:superfamily I DNA/RNA helicase
MKNKKLANTRFENGKLIHPSEEQEKTNADLDYLYILKALREIPFGVGKKLLIDFLQGNRENKSIKKNKLNYKRNFGSMIYTQDELKALINNLIQNQLIEHKKINPNKPWKMLTLTDKGKKEIEQPQLYKRKLAFNFKNTETEITKEEKQIFQKHKNFLKKYNKEQKKAIINPNKHILCIAGAGTGKTTVLTKRIEFLIKKQNINPQKILAITFTRKAKKEMKNKLTQSNLENTVTIETFNSFCEKILKKHTQLIYDKPVRVINYKDKIIMIKKALQKINMNHDQAIDLYFTKSQKNGKTKEQLLNIFRNDCFFIRDYFKFKHKKIDETSFEYTRTDHKKNLQMMIAVCRYIDAYMKKNGLRDFADQLIDTLTLFEKQPQIIPEFDHILIDEYQDINSTQIKLIDTLKTKNLFCVGDPRQSIYGWRGSDIKYILNFEEKHPKSEIITLQKNYRSEENLVKLINTSIQHMKLPDLKPNLKPQKNIYLKKLQTEEQEYQYITNKIKQTKTPNKEIFVLARTNKQLNKISEYLKKQKIKHITRSNEIQKTKKTPQKNTVTLATIHAIKGMEAEEVFITGCNNLNFPCKGSEHPVISMVKIDEYDKEEEERRIFYVAISRAKKTLHLTYSGKNPTYFINTKMKKIIENKPQEKNQTEQNTDQSLNIITKLKKWRKKTSNKDNIPAFLILNDRSLSEIAEKKPKNEKELQEIFGIGPLKISKYGEDILKLVNS